MNGTVNYSVEGAKYGISFGTALAIAISYVNNHSILWAIIHGFFSWLYSSISLWSNRRKRPYGRPRARPFVGASV
jgi:hypothetical protein